MRIAQVAPVSESVPPQLYGGTERVVSWLTEDLVALSHEVTLFASGDSKTAARLVPVWSRALRLARPRVDSTIAYTNLFHHLAERAADFDVIHLHIDWLPLPLMRALGARFLTTLHGRLDLPGLHQLIRSFPDAAFVSISNNQREPLPDANWAGTVYHGMPPDLLHPVYDPGGYAAFLGRITPEKGVDAAIRIARAANVKLRIAAKVPRDGSQYFKEEIEPQLGDGLIEFVGEVRDGEKQEFLGNAAALLFPIRWPEPFGLVMIEAMACGTPVIAFRHGSVPEVLEHGLSGFVVEDEAGAVAALSQIRMFDRRQVREAFESRFVVRRMTESYLRVYDEVISGCPFTPDRTALTESGARRVAIP